MNGPDNTPLQPQRMSIGLCVISPEGKILAVQRPQDDMLWQMPEFPVEIETDLSLAVTSAVELMLPNHDFDLIAEHNELVKQVIPEYLAKKEGLTGATTEYQKWFAIKLKNQPQEKQINKSLYPKMQWVKLDQLVTLVTPYKRLAYTTALEAFKSHAIVRQENGLANDFKSGSQLISEKTRQNAYN